MRYTSFGRTGLRVSELALGGMTIGNAWGWGSDKEMSSKLFKIFTDAGGNFIDTSCNYQDGESEKIIGELTKGNRDNYVIATKFTLHDHLHKDDPNAGGNSRKNLLRSVKGSLDRLQTDYIDILYLHMWEGSVNIEELMYSLNILIEQSKVNYIAISDTPAWVTATANTIAKMRGWEPFTGYQFPYNLARRDAEREIIPMAREHNMAMLLWNVIGAGLFSGKYTQKKETSGRIAKGILQDEKKLEMARKVDTIADEIGCTSSQLAYAWILAQEGIMIPIVGATKPEQLTDNIGALQVKLTQEQIKRISEVNAFDLGFPGDFRNAPNVKELIYGNTYDKIKF